MKKLIAVFFVVAIALTCVLSVAAAGSINSNEQAVLNELGKSVTVNGGTYKISSNYINAAKNYFLTIDMTKSESEAVISYIKEAFDVIKNSGYKATETELNLVDLELDDKQALLAAGIEAAEAIGLTLEYDATSEKVVITDEDDQVIFEDDPVIKKTGADVSVPVVAVIVVVLTVVAAGAVVVTKKVRQF